jgi:hypothetical protein
MVDPFSHKHQGRPDSNINNILQYDIAKSHLIESKLCAIPALERRQTDLIGFAATDNGMVPLRPAVVLCRDKGSGESDDKRNRKTHSKFVATVGT